MDSFQNPCNFISFWHHQDIFFRDCTDQQDNNQIYHSGCGDCQQGNNFAVRNFGDQVSCSAAEKGRNQRLPEYFKIVEADSGYLCQPDQAEQYNYKIAQERTDGRAFYVDGREAHHNKIGGNFNDSAYQDKFER